LLRRQAEGAKAPLKAASDSKPTSAATSMIIFIGSQQPSGEIKMPAGKMGQRGFTDEALSV
jgi:hypothetical protein